MHSLARRFKQVDSDENRQLDKTGDFEFLFNDNINKVLIQHANTTALKSTFCFFRHLPTIESLVHTRLVRNQPIPRTHARSHAHAHALAPTLSLSHSRTRTRTRMHARFVRSELKECMRRFGLTVSGRELDDMFTFFDRDKSGGITLQVCRAEVLNC